jgi:hypothetical protein
MPVSPRPASNARALFGRKAVLCIALGLIGLAAAPAAALAGEPTGCSALLYSQPFAPFKDFNYYMLVPGGEFKGSEGWELSGGAQIIQTTRPDGTTGGVLDVPGGGQAVSPTIQVTLKMPTARVWVRDVTGAEGVAASVAYEGTSTWSHPKDVGHVHGQHTSWTLSNPIQVQPQTAGSEEGPRTMRFVFNSGGKSNDTQLYGLWIDPRMHEESQPFHTTACVAPETKPPSGGTPSGGTSSGGTSSGGTSSGTGGGTPSLGGTLVRGASGGEETPVGVN